MATPYRVPQSVGDGAAAQALSLGLPVGTADRARLDAAFAQVYEGTFSKIYAFIRCQVSTNETAQELVSRIFLKAYKHWHKAPASGAGTVQWIFRIAHTTLIDYWRVEKPRELVSLPLDELAELPAGSWNPEEQYQRKERSALILRVMNDLPEGDRMMLALKFAALRTNREIAGIFELSEGAVSMRLLRALRRLRAQLGGMELP